MSAQTRSKKSQAKEPGGGGDIESTLSKDEQAIARFLRLKCGTKQGNLAGMKVEFFVANKLVDQLMESKWGPGKAVVAAPTTTTPSTTPTATAAANKSKNNKESLLSNRAACVALMQRLLNKQLFYRAYKVYKDEIESTTNESSSDKTPNLRKRKKEVAPATTTTTESTTADSTPKPGETTPQKEAKRKFKLELHQEQKFVDGNEPYVWIYDPISTKSYIIGALLILGAIGICLFPLWPSQVREGVYYLSVAGASFLGAILAIAAIKYVLYALVWTLTLGKCEFWLFPNLTEDVGFIESFIPVYKCTTSSSSSSAKKVEQTATATAEIATEPSVERKETIRSGNVMSSSMMQTRGKSAAAAAVMNELSKSTVEISTTASSSSSSRNSTESPSVSKNRKSSLTTSTTTNRNDDEDFELVDNEEELNNK